MQKEHNPTRSKSKEVSACQSDKSAFGKKLSGETNTDYKDITDFLTEEPVKVNGHAPEKSADLIVFIHFYVLLGRTDLQKEAILSLLAADCNHGILNGYAPEYVRQSFSKRCISFDSYIKPQRNMNTDKNK